MFQTAITSSLTRSAAAVVPLLKMLFLILGSFARVPFSYAAPVLPFADDQPKAADDPSLWAYLGVAAALVLLGGAFAGLTIAYVLLSNIINRVYQIPSNDFIDTTFSLRVRELKRLEIYESTR